MSQRNLQKTLTTPEDSNEKSDTMISKTLPDYFFEGCGGLLHDTRISNGFAVPVRKNYSFHHRKIESGADLRACLRAGQFAWPGGYEILYICSDGACLCAECVRKELRNIIDSIRSGSNDGWRVVGLYSMDECEESQICAHCGREVT